MAAITIQNGNTGAVRPATGPLDVVTAINQGDDILVNGQTAILTNSGGNWFVNGQPIAALFTPAMGPTVAPPDSSVPPGWRVAIDCGPGFVPAPDGSMNCVDPRTLPPPVGSMPSPIIRTDPFPVTAAGSLDLTPGTLVILAAAAYFLLRGRRS